MNVHRKILSKYYQKLSSQGKYSWQNKARNKHWYYYIIWDPLKKSIETEAHFTKIEMNNEWNINFLQKISAFKKYQDWSSTEIDNGWSICNTIYTVVMVYRLCYMCVHIYGHVSRYTCGCIHVYGCELTIDIYMCMFVYVCIPIGAETYLHSYVECVCETIFILCRNC